MATQRMEFKYVKSPQWRVVDATSAAINGIGLSQGFHLFIRFTHEWMDVEKEVFTAEVQSTGVPGAQTFTVASSPLVEISPLYKIEEVAVRMPIEGAVSFMVGMLTQLSQIQAPHKPTADQIKRISDALAALKV